MTQVTERRRALRVGVEKGMVFLRSAGVPSIACTLSDLSAEGFSCLAPLQTLDEATAGRWKTILSNVGHHMSVDISCPPALPGMHLEVETRYSRPNPKGMTIGFRFHALENRDANALKQALPNMFKAGSSSQHKAVNLPSPNGTHAEKAEPQEKKPALNGKAHFVAHHDPVPADDLYYGKKLGEILVMLSKLTDQQVEDSELESRLAREPLGRYLLRRAMISPADLCSALALQAGLPIVDLSEVDIDPELLSIFPPLTMLRYQFIPFAQTRETISVATTRPLPQQLMYDLRKKCAKKIQVFMAPDDVITAKLYKSKPGGQRKLRKHKRYEIAVPVYFHFARSLKESQEGLLYDGRTINISEGGLTIGTHENITIQGRTIRVRFALPPNTVDGLYTFRHSTRRSVQTFDDTPWVTGLEVLEMSAVSRSNLKAMCVRLGMWQQAEKLDDEDTDS